MTTHSDLVLLGAAVELTTRRIHVDAAAAWELVHGRPPEVTDWAELRRSVLRLERDGLVVSHSALRIEPTAAGRRAIAPTSSM